MSIQKDLIRYYRWLRRYGYNDSHSGNASVRDDDSIWVTPTGACADTLTTKELVGCTVKGKCGPKASLDAALHIGVYRRNKAARAILHSHGPYTVAVTMNGEVFKPIDFEGQYYFPTVPVVNIPYDEYVTTSPHSVADTLSNYPIMVIRGHGVYAWGENLNQAYKWTCSLEQSAKTKLLAIMAASL